MSMGIRRIASTQPSVTPTSATMIVKGRRRANRISHIANPSSIQWRKKKFGHPDAVQRFDNPDELLQVHRLGHEVVHV